MTKVARLLRPKRIVTKQYSDISHADMLRVIRSMRQSKYGYLEVACDVVELSDNVYNLRMEYIARD